VALALPRPVAPTETPGLSLSVSAAAEARALDEARAEDAPSGLVAETLLDAYYRHGNAEHFGTNEESFRQDRRSIARAAALLTEEHGDEALLAIQASVVGRLDDALAGRMEEAERVAFLGNFEQILSTYGLVDEGRWLAPDVAVRALFKARFNAALRQDLTLGLHPIELEAYWGWLALEARDAPTDRRIEALGEYERVHEAPAHEARGVLLFQAGRFIDSAEAFEAAYAETGSMRLRNHALAAMAEAEAD